MTIIDGDRLPGSIPNVPGRALELLELMSVATGRTPGELVALAIDAYFSTPVEDPAPLAVDSGPGAGTPSAPAIAPRVLIEWGAESLPCKATPKWWLHPASDPDDRAHACCDDHIPVGWVRPDESAASPAPQSSTGDGDGEAQAAGAGEVSTAGECSGSPATAHVYTDPDGDTLALVALDDRPADWLLRLTTMAGDGELDLWVEDDETLAGIARGWLGAIEDRPR